MGFHDKKTTKKGTLGEKIIAKYLQSKGFTVYGAYGDKAHLLDFLAIKTEGEDRGKLIAVEVKTKARFNKWAAQGIDKKHYYWYKKIAEDHPTLQLLLFFIDDKCGDVHCQDVRKLSDGNEEINSKCKGMIVWDLKEMIKISELQLSQEQIDTLSSFDTRKYDYEPRGKRVVDNQYIPNPKNHR